MTVAWLGSLCVLSGCTRKEELILLTEEGQEQECQSIPGENTEISGTGGEYSGALVSSAYIAEETGTIYVHVCGAVMAPGVYELTAGSRVYEAVQAAGGFTENAEENYVNQAQELPDGVKLVIPTKEEAAGRQADVQPGASGQEAGQTAADSDVQIGIVTQGSVHTAGGSADTVTAHADGGRININTASVEELCRIPGIGATRAAAVVSYRESHGSFGSPEDIMKVSGIKEGTYEKIKDSISVK